MATAAAAAKNEATKKKNEVTKKKKIADQDAAKKRVTPLALRIGHGVAFCITDQGLTPHL